MTDESEPTELSGLLEPEPLDELMLEIDEELEKAPRRKKHKKPSPHLKLDDTGKCYWHDKLSRWVLLGIDPFFPESEKAHYGHEIDKHTSISTQFPEGNYTVARHYCGGCGIDYSVAIRKFGTAMKVHNLRDLNCGVCGWKCVSNGVCICSECKSLNIKAKDNTCNVCGGREELA